MLTVYQLSITFCHTCICNSIYSSLDYRNSLAGNPNRTVPTPGSTPLARDIVSATDAFNKVFPVALRERILEFTRAHVRLRDYYRYSIKFLTHYRRNYRINELVNSIF